MIWNLNSGKDMEIIFLRNIGGEAIKIWTSSYIYYTFLDLFILILPVEEPKSFGGLEDENNNLTI